MNTNTIPQKTEQARALLAQSRHALNHALLPALRMLLITIDGSKSLGELSIIARSMGLNDSAFVQLRDQGLIGWPGLQTAAEQAAQAAETAARAAEAAAAQQRQRRLRGLVRAKIFALDLATLMLAGKEGPLREQAREVDSESRFAAWIDNCASAIAGAAGAERATLFRDRVEAVAS